MVNQVFAKLKLSGVFLEMRKAIFAETDALIRAHNAKEGTKFTMGHNKLSTMTGEEKQKMYMKDILG